MRKALVLFMLGALLFVLLTSITEMPSLGGENSPAYNEVAEHYIENAIDDARTPNVIAAIITDYRAFDTLGETTVLFTSIAAVISVISGGHKHRKEKVEK